MPYVVIARRWRPMSFDAVIGQEHVTRTLKNALKNQRIAHGYIFAGPRGVGKTTTARLLAKAVNCQNQPVVDPCNDCESCKSITAGNSMDVIEIDGASNRGIDEIRNLRENIRFAPASGKYKIYIIDEVHMLTKEAFNALLKTLEEPPEHAIFIFATTEIHKIPLTILSRCQRFDFKRIPVQLIHQQLRAIADAEGIEVSDDALMLIARKAEGSMRDAESIMDQLISLSEGALTDEQVRETLGLIDLDFYFQLTDLIKQHDNAEILRFAHSVFSTGHDLMDFLYGLQEHFRNLLLATALKDPSVLDLSDYYQKRYLEHAGDFKEADLIHFIQIISQAESEIKYSSFQQLSLEMLLLKLANKPEAGELSEILAFLENLQKQGGGAIPVTGPAGQTSSTASVTPPAAGNATPPPTGKTPSAAPATGQGAETKSEPSSPLSGLKNTLGALKNVSGAIKSTSREKSAVKQPQAVYQPLNTGQAPLTFDAVKTNWYKVQKKIRQEKITLGSFFDEGVPYKLEGDTLQLAFDKAASFHVESVQQQLTYIDQVVQEVLGTALRVKPIMVDFSKEGIELQPRTPEEKLEDLKKKEPIIGKIVDLFDLDKPEEIKD
ncbi:MAG: hypothetical protein Kow0037_04230 [Calditrichia bacterium]